ncbi:hypothetical protein OROHE_014844 [Orobanche hederae]
MAKILQNNTHTLSLSQTHTHPSRDRRNPEKEAVAADLGGDVRPWQQRFEGGARLTLDVYYTSDRTILEFDGSGTACGGRRVEKRRMATSTSGGAAATSSTEEVYEDDVYALG